MSSAQKDFLFGVNLGGWLVLEKWMTKHLFAGTDAVDEYTFMQTDGAAKKLRKHHQEFIREADFKWLARHGVNAVRIPVGYWILTGDAPYEAAADRLDWAFKMAKKYQLKVLLCLHGVPGSQNGRDHSGRHGQARWYKDAAYRTRTIRVLEALAQRYGECSALWGIELMNEPQQKLINRKLRKFYRQAYDAVDPLLPAAVKIVFSDAFTPWLTSGVMRGRERAVMDIHWYHFFTPAFVPLWAYFWLVRLRSWLLSRVQFQQPVIVGEWTGGFRYDQIRALPLEKQRQFVQTHVRLQMAAYRHAAGWFYWSYKTDGMGTWDFRTMVESGRLEIPSDMLQ